MEFIWDLCAFSSKKSKMASSDLPPNDPRPPRTRTSQRGQCSLLRIWVCVAAVLLWISSAGCHEKANMSNHIEITAADFHERLLSGKMMFLYFQQQVSPTISLFLMELEKSAEALQDYGVLVGKVTCKKEPVQAYCTDAKQQHRAFLFRGGKEFLSFSLDTVFDVNSIVAEVLFAILRDEVKYVHTDADLLTLEKAAKGKKDIVLGHVRSLGTQEHRSLMETAYVYGSKYQFILITGGPVLKQLGVNESSQLSRVWFVHCRVHGTVTTPVTSERCPLTRMRTALSTLSLHTFLQLMEAPLVSEVFIDPSAVPLPQFPYQLTPQVFLFSHPATEHLDLDTAGALAWRLRGLALLLLVHRQSPAVKTPDKYNAAYRLPEKSSEVKYLTLHSLDDVLELFTKQQEEEEEEEEEEEDSHSELDDEVAAEVYRNRGHFLDLDLVTQLTSDNFHSEVAQSSLTVALFYLKWDAVSMAFLGSFIEVAEKLEDSRVDNIQMCVVDCGEWTDLCAAQPGTAVPFQPITEFPSVLLIQPQQAAQRYTGTLTGEGLHRFIVMSRMAFPLLLSTNEEVTSFLQEVPHPDLAGYRPHKVLGLFRTESQTALSVFTEAAKLLTGEVLTGLLRDGLVEKWAVDHDVEPPAVLLFPSWGKLSHPSVLPVTSSSKDLLTKIHTTLLQSVPELTVENLPSFLSLGKALLLLFVGEEEDEIGQRQNQALVDQMRGVRTERYLPCWIHLGRTPAGLSVLGSYLGSLPPLPALVLTHLPSGDEVYQYPPNTPILAGSVLQWLQSVEDGTESPAGMLGGDSWPPAFEFYDFLKVMDMQEGDHRPPEEEEVKTEEVNVEEHLVTKTMPYDRLDMNSKFHSEL
ncbi:thioredoxin domain-containing protein 16 isoform X2 [Xiphophorus maculatus]|uniref:thioredoxin domain-containing protein 16 isoform X2 n=1 Tax=Xiphophorus maculatus TaxID=8083 RepID=UPI000C6E92AD|nr:thioredoxin domain-containing protein 16 isoform X2 [Xiphophorus maculatus]